MKVKIWSLAANISSLVTSDYLLVVLIGKVESINWLGLNIFAVEINKNIMCVSHYFKLSDDGMFAVGYGYVAALLL